MTLTKEDLKSEHEFQGAWITDKTIPYDKKNLLCLSRCAGHFLLQKSCAGRFFMLRRSAITL